jgi:hypothetical protein
MMIPKNIYAKIIGLNLQKKRSAIDTELVLHSSIGFHGNQSRSSAGTLFLAARKKATYFLVKRTHPNPQ